MRVEVRPADAGGCGHYRLIWPSNALQRAGCDVRVATLEHTWQTMCTDDIVQEQGFDGRTHYYKIPRVVDILDPPDVDVLVMQRPLRRQAVQMMSILQTKGIKIVVELDDDFEAVSPRNIAWKDTHPRLSPDRNHLFLREACKIADLVTVSTPALAKRYGRWSRRPPIILPNCVPESYTKLRPIPHTGTYIGWSGKVETHPDDLQQTRGVVASVARNVGAQIAVIGPGDYVHRNLGMGADQHVVASGWVPIRDYPLHLAQLDVGIVPLEISPFNHAKSWLKGLEFAAVQVPFVASPTDPYRLAFVAGAGRLAARPQDWGREIRRLLEDDQHRADVVGRGYEFACHWTYENQAEHWWDAWTAAWKGTPT